MAARIGATEAALLGTGGDPMTPTEVYNCKMALKEVWKVMLDFLMPLATDYDARRHASSIAHTDIAGGLVFFTSAGPMMDYLAGADFPRGLVHCAMKRCRGMTSAANGIFRDLAAQTPPPIRPLHTHGSCYNCTGNWADVIFKCDHLVLCKSCAEVTTTCPVKGCSQILDPEEKRTVCIPLVRE